jgi:hypothetical protein
MYVPTYIHTSVSEYRPYCTCADTTVCTDFQSGNYREMVKALTCEAHVTYRVARFFFTRYTKKGGKYTKLPICKLPNGQVKYQMAVIYAKWP